MLLQTVLPILVFLGTTLSHPGEDHDHSHDIDKRKFFEHTHRSLEKACARRATKRGINPAQTWARKREEHIKQLRSQIQAKKRTNQAKRQTMPSGMGNMSAGAAPSGSAGGGGGGSSLSDYGASILNTSHHSDRTDITLNITSTELFNSTENLCLLQPEATIGPYWVSGEYIRDDLTEDQEGVDLYMTAQFLDTTTCEPVDNMYWEVWHCNSTGVYSGVVASGNGDSSDLSNLNNTFLRGLTTTDENGVATMHTLFPGHYSGRATHAHIIGHLNATVLANGTIGSGSTGDSDSTTVHIGQLFFDQDLITEVNTISPYSTNDAAITLNTADSILAGELVETAPDPVMNYVYLGDSIEDGIYAWVTIGVDTSASYTTSAASILTADGGVENDSSSFSGGGGGSGSSRNGTGASGIAADDTVVSASSVAAASTSTASSAAVAGVKAPAVFRHIAAMLV